MKIINNPKAMQAFSQNQRRQGKTIGFVPTMGALHEGHLSLIRQARQENDIVIVSIFVNPAQFGPKEDLRKYPRNLRRDAKMCAKLGVDIIFNPDSKPMYPQNYKTYVAVEDLSWVLCGKFRPGHFRGVATVVTKLFNIVSPDVSYFGQKDAQQAIIIKKMVEDLDIPVRIEVMPTVRAEDGLALSSRNTYLNEAERRDALVLSQALHIAEDLAQAGVRDSAKIIRCIKGCVRKRKTARLEYASIIDLDDLTPVKAITEPCLLALAVWIGKTRLIDNTIIRP